MEKNKNAALAMCYEVLQGKATHTAEQIANASGYTKFSIPGFMKEARAKLAEDGVEIAPPKRGRKAGSTNASTDSAQMPLEGTQKQKPAPSTPKAPTVDVEALRASIEAELRAKLEVDVEALKAKIKADVLAAHPISAQDILREYTEVEAEIKTLSERKATLIRQFDELTADTVKKFEAIKNASALKKVGKQAAE